MNKYSNLEIERCGLKFVMVVLYKFDDSELFSNKVWVPPSQKLNVDHVL